MACKVSVCLYRDDRDAIHKIFSLTFGGLMARVTIIADNGNSRYFDSKDLCAARKAAMGWADGQCLVYNATSFVEVVDNNGVVTRQSYTASDAKSFLAKTQKISNSQKKYAKLQARIAAEKSADKLLSHAEGANIIAILDLRKPINSNAWLDAVETVRGYNDAGVFAHCQNLVSDAINGRPVMPADIVAIQSVVKSHFGLN